MLFLALVPQAAAPAQLELIQLDSSASSQEFIECRLEVSNEIRLDDKGDVPTQVTLLTAGTVKTRKGTFVFDAEAAAAVLAKAADWGNDYCFDYGHSMVSPQQGASPKDNEEAAGWYKLKIDEKGNLVTDGLTWVGDAGDRIKARKFRYTSPTIRIDAKTKRVTEFINAALTNLPATDGQRPLVASRITDEVPPEPKMKSLLAALKLPSTATEDEALAALSKLLSPRTEVFALTGKQDMDEALEDLKSFKAEAAKVPELTAKIVKMKAKKESKKLERLLDEAEKEGRCPPSMREEMLELGRKSGTDFLKKALKTFKKFKPTDGEDTELARARVGAASTVELTKQQKEVCAMLNLDEKSYLAMMTATGGKVPTTDVGGTNVDGIQKDAESKSGTASGVTPLSAAADTSGQKTKVTTSKDA